MSVTDDLETLIPAPGPSARGGSTAAGRRYALLRVHAQGGLGRVWLARDADLDREVALKEIRPDRGHDAGSCRRFLREARITGQLEHPNIVPVYELARRPEDDVPFYTMRMVRGRTLRESIASYHSGVGGPGFADLLGLQKLLDAFVSACQAIGYAHARGVVHRDIKPENVVLGDFGEVIVLDWGLARVLESAGDSGRVTLGPDDIPEPPRGPIGTPAYMAPEQAAGADRAVGPAADVYGLGAILHEILTGLAPGHAPEVAAALGLPPSGPVPRPRDRNPAVPRPLDAICGLAMRPTPGERYADPRSLAEDVRRWAAGEPVSAWPEPWRLRALRWVRRHRTAVSSGVAAVAVALAWGGFEAARAAIRDAGDRARAEALVGSLGGARIAEVPRIVLQLAPLRRWADPPLRDLARSRAEADPARLHAAIALLPVDPGQAAYLTSRLLVSGPDALPVLRDALADSPGIREAAWRVALDPSGPAERRFRAACALAAYAPGDPRWPGLADGLVDHLVRDEGRDSRWPDLFRPIGPFLVGALGPRYRSRDFDATQPPAERARVADLLLDYAPAGLNFPPDLIADSDPVVFEAALARARTDPGPAITALSAAADRASPAPSLTPGVDPLGRREILAARRSRALVALARLGRPGALWPALRHEAEPDGRSYLVRDLAALRLDRRTLADRLAVEPDDAARRALILALAEYPGPPAPDLLGRAEALLRESPDPGVRAAASLALRRWGRAPKPEPAPPSPGRGWAVTVEGHEMVIVPGPFSFTMGAPESERGRKEYEASHRRRVGRSYAMGATEVTQAQFLRFLDANPGVTFDRDLLREYGTGDDHPAHSVTWYQAAQYCRWLSEREGVPESEMVYPPVAEIRPGLFVPPGNLRRTGYRLPTEAEWEAACRAGTASAHPFGEGDALLPRHAHFNAEKTAPVGLLVPNDWGFFDMLGNVAEWCHEPNADYPADGTEGNDEIPPPGEPSALRTFRGGAFGYQATDCFRSASREAVDPITRNSTFGLRVARTLRR